MTHWTLPAAATFLSGTEVISLYGCYTESWITAVYGKSAALVAVVKWHHRARHSAGRLVNSEVLTPAPRLPAAAQTNPNPPSPEKDSDRQEISILTNLCREVHRRRLMTLPAAAERQARRPGTDARLSPGR